MEDKTRQKFNRLIKEIQIKNEDNEYIKGIIEALKRDRDSYDSKGIHYNEKL